MNRHTSLSSKIDAENYKFSNAIKTELLLALSTLSDEKLEWLVMEHYQFSKANAELLVAALQRTVGLNERVSVELRKNIEEEDGHAPMYKLGMLNIGTDMDHRVEFLPTSTFLSKMKDLASENPSRALGALYASETAAIFEHQVFDQICAQLAARRGYLYPGSVIQEFHDIHLRGGVEQGHKDGLATLIDSEDNELCDQREQIDYVVLYEGAIESIRSMQTWWNALLQVVLSK
jgi:hypothetical protein